MRSHIAFAVVAVLVALATHAAARQPAPAGPADPAAKVPPPRYESAFAGYVPYREQKLAPWREVNDEVGRVGGHIGILRGAGKPGQPAGESQKPTGTPHAGH